MIHAHSVLIKLIDGRIRLKNRVYAVCVYVVVYGYIP
jgi:hypothetical protein